MTNDDPLANAAIGETVTVRETRDIWVGGLEPDEFRGSDRFGTVSVADTETVIDEYGDEYLRVTVEGDVTKALSPNWDQCCEPRTDAERQSHRRRKWLSRAGKAIGITTPLVVATVVTGHVMEAMAGTEMFGEPVQVPSMLELGGTVFLIAALVLIISHGLQGGFPRVNGGIHR